MSGKRGPRAENANEPGFLEENMKNPTFARHVMTQMVARGIARQLLRVMDIQRVTKADLAARVQRTEEQVDALLDDPVRMTVGDLSDLAQALGFRLRVGVEP